MHSTMPQSKSTMTKTPSKPKEDMLDAERLRQIARRKEQNRNAQRRLRERKEEYTMQLEAQLAELHRRSQSQEEESHFLREALARMRAENHTLAQQIAMIHQAVPSTQATHPFPQRASIDLGVDPFAHSIPLSRGRNRSQSASTATQLSMLPINAGEAPSWSAAAPPVLVSGHDAFGQSITPQVTHRMSMPEACDSASIAQEAVEGSGLRISNPDLTMVMEKDCSRRRSDPPSSHRTNSSFTLSPFDSRGSLSRHGSGQTELTIPSDPSDIDGPLSAKIQRTESTRTNTPQSRRSHADISRNSSIADGTLSSMMSPQAAQASDEVMASCLESIHSMSTSGPAHSPEQSSRHSHFDFAAASWMNSSADTGANLSLSDLRATTDLASAPKALGITPGAFGLAHTGSAMGGPGGEGWTISPWINMANTPSSDIQAQQQSQSDVDMSIDTRKSLASRRGFSGSLKIEPLSLS